MRIVFFHSVLVMTTSTVLAADASIDKPAAQQAIARSITWLESDMRTWREERGCAACHHGPMYLWSINVAKRQGYEVNESQLQEFTRWLLTDDEARIFPKSAAPTQTAKSVASSSDRMTEAMMGHRNLSQPTIYLSHALNALPEQEPLRETAWKKVIEHLVTAQGDDGAFVGRDAWRPIFNTPQILTLFVVAGLRDAAVSNSSSTEPAERQALLKSAEAFLSKKAPDETQQGLVLRLLSEPRQIDQPCSDDQSTNVAELVHRLTVLQRSDGGWSQTDDRESDAFATGQTLTALHRTGVSSSNPSIRRGIAYLLRTQNQDGTWPMTSRPNPETGKPAKFLNPITYAATAWATLGLTSVVPQEAP